MKIQKLLMIALAATTFAACSNDDEEPTPQQPAQTTRPLTISVTENPFVDPDGNPTTRGAITTTGTLSEFKMDYVYELGEERPTNGTALTATKDGDKGWTIRTGWPDVDNDKTIDWYAYTGSETVFHTGGTKSGDYISFTVDETIADQNDLLVATAGGTYDGTGGRLSFTFDHACAALRFYMKKAKNISDYTLTVKEVILHNIVKVGYYNFSSGLWTPGATTSNYTLFSSVSGEVLSDEDYVALDTSDKPYLFLIPQTLTAWNGTGSPTNTYLEITCTIRNGDDTVFDNGTAYIPFGYTLEKGTQYDVNINIGKNSLYKSDGTKVITD